MNTQNSSKRSEKIGNTKQSSPRVLWCFTWNNYSNDDFLMMKEWCSSNSSMFIIGKEVGENGTMHLQGFFKLNTKKRLSALKKISSKIHFEACRGSVEDNIKYCSKDGDFVSGGCYVPKPLKLITKLRPWQQKCIDLLDTPIDDRKIQWFWEPDGNMGKTTFCKYLCAKYNAIPVEGSKKDILYCAANFETDLYVFDFERSMEEYVSYGAMEKIKGGLYMCAKYESRPVIRNSPNVFVFANFEPDYKTMSLDRWVVTRL